MALDLTLKKGCYADSRTISGPGECVSKEITHENLQHKLPKMNQETAIWVTLLGASVVATIMATSLNFFFSRQGSELSGWYGWVAGFLLRFVTLLALGAGVYAIKPKYAAMGIDVNHALLASTGVLVLGMVIDAVISTRRLR